MEDKRLKDCIDACLNCATECSQCMSACIREKSGKDMSKCILLDRECAAICMTAAEIISIEGEHMHEICGVCAKICDSCAEECERHSRHHDHCARCAEACRNCAEECRKMAGEGIGFKAVTKDLF